MDMSQCQRHDNKTRDETYAFGDRLPSGVPLETALSPVPPDTAEDDVFEVAEAGGRSAGAEGADGANGGYDLGLASRSTEGGASGAAEADAIAVVMMMIEGVQHKEGSGSSKLAKRYRQSR